MPHSNRSQSSSNPRFHSSQVLDASLLSRSNSMPKPESPVYNASVRRLGSRRARPTVASIADVFVSSLVVASFCRDHSPRGRGLSTMSMNAPRDHMARWRGRNMAGNRQLSSRRRLEYLGAPTENLGAHCSTAQRMFNSGVAPRVEEDEEDDHTTESLWEESSLERPEEDVDLDPLDYLNAALELQSQNNSTNDDSTTDNTPPAQDNTIVFQDPRLDDGPDPTNNPHESSDCRKPSPNKEKDISVSQLYRATLGDKLNWKTAHRAVKGSIWGRSRPVPGSPKAGKDMTANADHIQSVQLFLDALSDEKISNQYIFRLYRELPTPGVSYLSKRSRSILLRRFANPPNRRWVDARRYLALVEDMVTAELHMSRSLWSSAIHLAGRASGKVFKRDLVRSIGLWQQMEHLGGVKSDEVVFTILFDIAIKASQFTVADRLVEEMTKRGLKFSRNGKVTQIYYYGMRHDADGIRRVYDEFVSSGEVVDTVVLNCLLVSFIRAGEFRTAEELYHRMLQSQATIQKERGICKNQAADHQPTLSSELRIYRKRSKRLGHFLKVSASLKGQLPEHHDALQRAFPMTPDTRTFHILLSFHAYQSGNLNGFLSVLGDMENAFGVPPRGMVYLLLFEGFARHGGKRKHWSADRLRDAWKAYLRALYESKTRLNDKFQHRHQSPVWENPLLSSVGARVAKPVFPTDAPNELYTPLPGRPSSEDAEDGREHGETRENDEDEESKIGANNEMVQSETEIDVDELFGHQIRDQPTSPEDWEELERQIENGVFLGRRMIIIIIRAFGACCGPKEVMEVWLQIERIWQPRKRKAIDTLAVKEELEKQMNRTQRFHL